MARRLTLFLSLLLATAVLGGASAAAGPVQDGQALFDEKCSSCHTIGAGAKVGPDLEGVTGRLGKEETRAFILAPDQARPGTAMPNLALSEAEADALVAYLESTGAGAAPQEPAPAQPAETQPAEAQPAQPSDAAAAAPPAGDADRGKSLFTGATRLENEGPPCMSCHSIAGIGALGGGAVGPDLTSAYEKYGGAQGISSILATLPFPTMVPIFDGQPLTASEQADLAAFLAEAPQAERPAGAAGKLVGLSLGAVAALTVLALLLWRRRLVAVRRPLVNRSRLRK